MSLDKRPPAKCIGCGKLTSATPARDDYRCPYCKKLARRYETEVKAFTAIADLLAPKAGDTFGGAK